MVRRLLAAVGFSAAFAVVGLFAAVAGGCSTVKVPTERFMAAESAIRDADAAGAEKVPAAASHLQMARDQAERAKKLAADGDAEHAHNMSLRAEADAELATALAREEPLRVQAQDSMNKAKQLGIHR